MVQSKTFQFQFHIKDVLYQSSSYSPATAKCSVPIPIVWNSISWKVKFHCCSCTVAWALTQNACPCFYYYYNSWFIVFEKIIFVYWLAAPFLPSPSTVSAVSTVQQMTTITGDHLSSAWATLFSAGSLNAPPGGLVSMRNPLHLSLCPSSSSVTSSRISPPAPSAAASHNIMQSWFKFPFSFTYWHILQLAASVHGCITIRHFQT